MEEEAINHIKHKLPFIYKYDRQSFYENVSMLVHFVSTKRVSVYLAIDIVYTLIALLPSKEWKKVVNDVYDTFNFKMKVELFKLLIINVESNEEKGIIEKFKKLIVNCDTDEEIMKVCFVVSTDFVKPTLLSVMKTFNIIPPIVTKVMGNEAFDKLKSISNKMKCLQKLIDVTTLSSNQLDFLMDYLNEPEYTNIILDLFLRSESWEHVSLAEKRLNVGHKRYFEVDNNVHYFDFINLDKIPTTSSGDFIRIITELIEISKDVYLVIDKIYDFITFVINCSHSYAGKTLKDIFCYVWDRASKEHSQANLVKLIHKEFVSICARGFATNMLLYLKELGDEEDYLTMNEVFVQKDKIISRLREIHPGDDEIWLDKDRLVSEIKKEFSNDVDSQVINLIVGV